MRWVAGLTTADTTRSACCSYFLWAASVSIVKSVDRGGWSFITSGSHQRIRWYMREWGKGILVLACGKCNKKQGSPPAPNEEPIPF